MMNVTENRDEVRDLITAIARALVDESDAVVVDLAEHPEGKRLSLRTAPSDVGKVIGKQGRTVRSMRTILAAVSMKLKCRYTLEVIEEHK